MKHNKENPLPQDKDRHLDVPAEANRDNNINFLELEDNNGNNSHHKDKETTERQKQWSEGLEEGRKLRDNE